MPELTCFRLLDAEFPAGPLAEAVRQVNVGQGGAAVFTLDPISFKQVPNAPFAYWVEEKVRRLFKDMTHFESAGRTARQGLATTDDNRFVRCWWEPPAVIEITGSRRWWTFAKGGAFSPYYADLHLLVNWAEGGAEVKQNIIQRYPYLKGNAGFVAKNTDYYFRHGLTWPLRTNGLSFRLLPRGAIFAHKGPAAFIEDNPLATCALVNSRCFGYLVSVQLARVELAQSFEVGIIQNTPMPSYGRELGECLQNITLEIISLKRRHDTLRENSHSFVVPWHGERLIQLKMFESELHKFRKNLDRCLEEKQAEIERHAEALFAFEVPGLIHYVDPISEVDEEGDDSANLDAAPTIVSYLTGVAFGRWAIPANPEELRKPPVDPFSALPGQAPGAAPFEAAKLYFVEDASGESPLLNSCRSALRQATGLASVDGYEQDLASRLGVPALRDYLSRTAGFFADHLAVYSKSRRKAPIYWPLSTRSGEFILWVYYPKLDADSLPRLITEVLDPRLRGLSEEISTFVAEGRTAGRRAKLEALQLELAEMRQDFQALIAKGYKPDLNDGVLITACPLAKYFRHAGFRKNLDACWKELARGDYDWAHLAMSMWPERVLAACKQDRSIAIAHAREDLCPAEPTKVSRIRKKKTD
jgi:hypothetical protein